MLVESLTSDWREVLLHTPFSVTPPPSPFQSENPGIVIMSLVRTHAHAHTHGNQYSFYGYQTECAELCDSSCVVHTLLRCLIDKDYSLNLLCSTFLWFISSLSALLLNSSLVIWRPPTTDKIGKILIFSLSLSLSLSYLRERRENSVIKLQKQPSCSEKFRYSQKLHIQSRTHLTRTHRHCCCMTCSSRQLHKSIK